MPLRDDLLNPIEGENPSGANLRYAPVFDKIKEARREDDDAPQGDWAHERKLADYKTVLKLAGDTLAKKTKDLQIAAWMTEALLRQEGFAGLLEGLQLIHGLLDNFWDTLYPEIDEDGDMELRAAPIEWVGTTLGDALRKTPITRGGYDFYKYKESRAVGYEDEANEQQRQVRATKVSEGALTPEEFDKDSAATPAATYEEWQAALDGSLEELDALQLLCEEKFGGQAPSFSGLRAAAEEVRHQIHVFIQKRSGGGSAAKRLADQPAVKLSAPVAAPESSSEWGSDWNDPTAQPSVEGEGDAETETESEAGFGTESESDSGVTTDVIGLDPSDLDDAAMRLDAIARFLRQQDAESPGPYLLLRGYRWGELRGYGASPDPLNLLPPDSQVRQNIRRLSLESNWSELLEAAESAMASPCGRAWLDLQRYVVRAAEESGYTAISQAIRSELRALLADLPDLPTWTLMDDTPAANPETQAWLKKIGVCGGGARPTTYQAPSSMMEDETEILDVPEGEAVPPDAFELAMDAAREGRAADAVQMLADEIPRQRSGRAKFQRKLQLAQICLTTGHEILAQPILEELMESIDARGLEEWEAPDSVAHPLALLYRCLSKNEEADPELKHKLFARISRLDPVQALECLE